MAFSPGDKLGPYEIVALIGKGGMGEVYRGTDTRLGRPVAIKTSAREFSDRFEREARAISALNHPHICTLYDVGPNYLVMEFVEGEMLSQIVERDPIPLDKALQYAVQIVDALAAAHAKGIIHRDLKPGNIILTKNGVKVLDFGLAKLNAAKGASAPASSDVATMTQPITAEGRIVGTLYYMSPEQVEAKETDERSDIFSFGAVFYEMITGRRAFEGDSQASVLASILKDQPPPMSERQPGVPRAIARVVRKCLEKKPDDRWQSARDLKPTLELIDLEAPASTGSGSGIPAQAPSRRRWLWPAAAAAAALIAAGAAYEFRPKSEAGERVTRFEVPLPEGVQIDPTFFYLQVSPDGSKLAFTTAGAKGGIWIRDLESVQVRLLPGTANAIGPFWSPDGKSIGFGQDTRLMRVDVSGGPPQVVCTSDVGSGYWTADGEIVFSYLGAGPLQRVPQAGGAPVTVTELAPGESHHSLPSFLPNGRDFLYLIYGPAKPGIYAGSLDIKPGRQPRDQIVPAGVGATFVRTGNASRGYLFYVRDGTLMAQAFDAKALRVTRDPIPVVRQIGIGLSHAHFSVTSGVMAHRTGPENKSQLTWLDREGNIIDTLGKPRELVSISLSPDEKQLAIVRSDTGSQDGGDIWLLDLARNVETLLTSGRRVRVRGIYGPVWSPDGERLAYASGTGIYVKDAGGAADAKLVKDLGHPVYVTDWTHDGRYLIYDDLVGPGDVRQLPAEGGEPAPAVVTEAKEARARISPDGQWIAYDSDRSGQTQVYVRPYATPGSGTAPAGPVIQISREGGLGPKWSADGTQLLFVSSLRDRKVMAAKIDRSSGGFRPEAPIETGIKLRPFGAWATSKSNQRFLVALPLDRGAQTPITVVTNWEASLKRNQ